MTHPILLLNQDLSKWDVSSVTNIWGDDLWGHMYFLIGRSHVKTALNVTSDSWPGTLQGHALRWHRWRSFVMCLVMSDNLPRGGEGDSAVERRTSIATFVGFRRGCCIMSLQSLFCHMMWCVAECLMLLIERVIACR